LDFYLEGVECTAANAVQTAQRLVALFDEDRAKLQRLGRSASSASQALNVLRERPIVSLNEIRERANVTFPTASKGMNRLVQAGIAREITGQRRNRIFAYDRYLAILNEGTNPE